MYRPALIAGCVSAALAVVLGAFGAHKLKDLVAPETVGMFQTGVTYQFYHSFALIAVGLIYAAFPAKVLHTAHWFFILGIVCFSGSLYAMAACKAMATAIPKWIGLITPVGGVFFIVGWVCLLIGILNRK